MLKEADTKIFSVLYLDDDPGLVRLVQKSFQRMGYEVVHAANWDEARTRLLQGGIDVVALDHYLGTETGLDVLAHIAELERPPPVVYVTGSSELSVAVAALKAGAADFVPKTVNDDFMALLSSAFDRAIEKQRLHEKKELAESEVRAARDRAELLLREVNHRMANSLSMVASFVSLQSNSLTDEAAKMVLAETQNRIQAISLVHRELYTKGDFRFVALNAYLGNLIFHMKEAARGTGTEIGIEHELAQISLPTNDSINLGVIVIEWISNALKYAYPSGKGDIRVVLKTVGDNEAELTVSDRGVGYDSESKALGTGFGTRIVRAMAASLKGGVEYASGNPGTIARLTFPLNSAIAKS